MTSGARDERCLERHSYQGAAVPSALHPFLSRLAVLWLIADGSVARRLAHQLLALQGRAEMKLQTLKPRLQAAGSRVATLAPVRPNTVERKRGWAGVKDRNRIRERDCGLCQECLRNHRTSVGTAVDHIVPLWKGGSDDDTNKELLCNSCHDVKTAREAAERARTSL